MGYPLFSLYRVGASSKGQGACSELDDKPVLIDGRNRREACRRAGVSPDYVLLDGQDPVAYIVSANINRRHLTVGQRAMLIAILHPEGGRGKTPIQLEFSGERLRQARFVLRYAPDLLDPVRSGALSLNNAYEEARLRKGRTETYEARFNALKEAAPDLADMVTDGQLNLEEAQAAYDQRVSEQRREKGVSLRARRVLKLITVITFFD
jgi:hypothetical protein